MNIENDFVWNTQKGYAVIEKYVKKYKSARDLKPGEEPEEKEKTLILPSEYDGMPVKEIFDAAFAMNDIIEEIVVPDSVEKIGNMTFNQCHNLKKITLSKNLKRLGFFSIHDTPIYDDEKSYKDGLLIIDNWVVSVKDDVTELKIPPEVIGISDHVLYFADKLKEVIFPDTVKYLGMRVFCFNLDLEKAVIPDKGIECSWQLFGANLHIKKLIIPESVYNEQKIVLRNGKNIPLKDCMKDGKIEVESVKIDEVEFN